MHVSACRLVGIWFLSVHLHLTVRLFPFRLNCFAHDSDGSPNKFVELTLRLSLITVISLTGLSAHECLDRHPSVFIELRADSEFYALPSAGKTGKTGLGSSAALVASLVTALFAHFGVGHPSLLTADDGDARLESAQLQGVAHDSIPSLLHHVAQAAHCAAQGKVGSGFDISAAFFGSQKYRRFDPSILAAVVEVGAILMFLYSVLMLYC
jgi:phosphomevalonate kinase